MTFEEKVERAERMRSRDLYGKVEAYEFEDIKATQTSKTVEVEGGLSVKLFEIAPSDGISSDMIIVNFHGGGFIKGRQDKDRLFCSKMAMKYGCLVWDIDYSLAPEYPFPTAVNESYAIVKHIVDNAESLGVDKNKIMLMGHSAGGNLVAGICITARKTNDFKPAGAIIEFSPLDLYTDPANKPRIEGDIPAEVAKTYNAFYTSGDQAKDPLASPIFATDEMLSKFPKTLIITAKLDGLSFEAEEFALKLARAGGEVTVKRFQNSHHGFTINRMEDWEEAHTLIEEFTNSCIAHLN